MPSTGPDGLPRAWLSLYLALAAATCAPVLAWPTRFMLDDALFYFQIGHQFAETHRSTFNGLALTNGYHPLWMLACALLSLVTGGNKTALLYSATFVQALLWIGTASFAVAALRDRARSWWWTLVPLTGYFCGAIVIGSEAALNGLMLSLFVWLAATRGNRSRPDAWIGVALGLAILARLDNVFVAVAYAVGRLLLERPWRRTVNELATSAAVAACFVLPYLALNVLYFGHLMPISGAVKSTLPHLSFSLRSIGKLGVLLTGLSLVSLAWVWAHRHRPGVAPLASSLWALNLGWILLTLYLVTATAHHTAWHWYYVSPALSLAFTLPFWIDSAREALGVGSRPRWVAAVGIAALVCSLGSVAAKNWVQARTSAMMWYEPRNSSTPGEAPWPESMGRELDARLQPGSGVLVFDLPGYFAFFSRLAIVPVDGLVMDFASDAYMREHGIEAYLARLGIRYIVVAANPPDGPSTVNRVVPSRTPNGLRVRFFTPIGGRDAGTIELADSCRAFSLSDATTNRWARRLEIGVWRFPCPARALAEAAR